MTKFCWLFIALLPIACCCVLASCSNTPRPADQEVKAAPKTNESLRVAMDLLRQAADPSRCREGLQHFNTHLQQNPELQAKCALDADARKFLVEQAALTADELQEAGATNFRPADAYYLAECFLLRDAVRALEIAGLPPEELARNCFGWALRQVLLHQQGDTWLPPGPVLRRGHGSARDRALVFLALVRQIRVQAQQLEGCVFTSPDAPDDVILVGVLSPHPQGKDDVASQIWLFDPRLGMPVRNAGGKLATLADVRADTTLLEPSGLSGDQLKKLQVRLVCPLQAMAPRMRELERALAVHDRVALHLDAARLERQVTLAAGMPARVWNAPAAGDKVENSPTRTLRIFLPPDEGGVDKDGRFKRFQAERGPLSAVWLALEQINLGPSALDKVGFAQLVGLTNELWEKYDQQPRDMLLRGKAADVVQRFDRGRAFVEDEGGIDDAAFQKGVADWRERVNTAYAALASKDPQGQSRVNSIWGEDQFLLALLQVDIEDPPTRFPKQFLTRIVAHGIREHLAQRALWTRGLLWQDKAERDQAMAAKNPGKAKGSWLNARAAWNQYLDRSGVSLKNYQQRVAVVQKEVKRSTQGGAESQTLHALHAAHLLEALHLDLHQHVAARMHQAKAAYYLDGAKAATPLLRSLDQDLTALLDRGKNDSPGLKADVDAARQRLRAPALAPLARSLDLLQNDWTPQGNYDWLQKHVRRQLDLWERP